MIPRPTFKGSSNFLSNLHCSVQVHNRAGNPTSIPTKVSTFTNAIHKVEVHLLLLCTWLHAALSSFWIEPEFCPDSWQHLENHFKHKLLVEIREIFWFGKLFHSRSIWNWSLWSSNFTVTNKSISCCMFLFDAVLINRMSANVVLPLQTVHGHFKEFDVQFCYQWLQHSRTRFGSWGATSMTWNALWRIREIWKSFSKGGLKNCTQLAPSLRPV
jgi:hypothetical protein